jgi:thioredoxin reductase (NADPH)
MFDCVIVGGGPAGLSASIYVRRSNLNVAIIEGNMPGGQMANTAVVENYPGYESIAGADLAMKMYMHAINLGVEYIAEYATDIKKEEYFTITLANGETVTARTVIIATGMKHRKLHVPGEEEFTGKGVSWCAICDGNLYRGKDVAVVGGGNSAVEESIYLAGIVNKVYLIHRRDEFRCDKLVLERLKRLSNVELILNDEVKELVGGDSLEKIILKSGKELIVSGLFEYIGFLPSSEVISTLNIVSSDGFIEVDENCKTKIERQIETAVSDGAIAALHAAKCCR